MERVIPLSCSVRCAGCCRLGLQQKLTHGADAGAVHLYALRIVFVVSGIRWIQFGDRQHRKPLHMDGHI